MSNKTTDHEPFYFGWVSPSRTEPEGEKFDLAVHDDPVPDEIATEFHEVIGVIPKIRPTFIDFLAFRADYFELLDLPEALISIFDTPRFAMFDVGVRNIESHALAERHLSSFLNSGSAFRGRLLARESAHSSSTSVINAKMAELYDRFVGFRICHNLRNYSQHRANPLHIIPVNASRGVSGKLDYRIDLELDRDRLISADSKFQAKVKGELRAMDSKIPLIPNCVEYYGALRELFSIYLSLSGEDIQKAIGYESAVRSTFPHMPADATPLMFQGKPKRADGEFKTKVTSFSFDELELLKEVLMERVN